ncbi:hypothetical protein [Nonomuraea diastatica]|uniref:Uncharacterized protein n=1 Tax=Nonomuraea diastatica TaxID=1848329 RepID=A0A4R4WM88_9ACTN|nr:hypothetical protein [Nonomuraea diastatica]TDD20289.1 hypothetical protein E1294_18475 [Nonomuraea diastatica]
MQRTKIYSDIELFRRAAEEWSRERQFPLLAGPETARAAHWLTRNGDVADLPAVSPEPRPGVVVSCGDGAVAAIAGLLARATDRSHEHVAPSEVPGLLAHRTGELVALVGLPDDIEAIGDWPGQWAPALGVVTARGLPALAALVYRSLILPDLPTAPDRRLVHPSMPGSQDADVISYGEKDLLTERPSRVLALRSHGRECCVHLPDGIICGRSDSLDTYHEAQPGRRLPSCMLGTGCFRLDLDPEDRIPARSLTASVVYVHACDPVAPGVNAMPHSVNVALGFLDGTAVAVVGAVGRQRADPDAEKVLVDALNAGLRLGEAVTLLNEHGQGAGGEMSVTGLLGDPAIIVPDAAVSDVVHQDAGRAMPAAIAVDPAHIDEARYLTGSVLRPLDVLRWADVPADRAELARIDDAALLVAQACLQAGHPAAGQVPTLLKELADDLVSVQHRMLDGLAGNAYGTWWQFGGPARTVYRQDSAHAERCPHCGRPSGRRVVYRHHVKEALELRLGLCRRCGPWQWRIGREEAVRHRTAIDRIAYVGEPGTVTMTLENPFERTVRGAAAFCFVNGAYERHQKPACWPLALGPGERREVTAAVTVQRAVNPDLHEAVFMTLLDGTLTVLPIFFDVRPVTSVQ